MTTPTQDELREKILFDSQTHDKDCGVTLTRDLGNCDCNKTELWAAIEAYKDNACRELLERMITVTIPRLKWLQIVLMEDAVEWKSPLIDWLSLEEESYLIIRAERNNLDKINK